MYILPLPIEIGTAAEAPAKCFGSGAFWVYLTLQLLVAKVLLKLAVLYGKHGHAVSVKGLLPRACSHLSI